MKQPILAISLGIFSLLFGAAAHAEGRYLTTGLDYYKFDPASESLDGDYFAPAISVGLGRMYTPYIGWENRLGIGLGEVTESYTKDGYNHDYTFNLTGYVSTLVVGVWPVTESVDLYAKAGITGLIYGIKEEYEDFAGHSGGSSEMNNLVFTPTIRLGADYNFSAQWSAGFEAAYLGRFEDDQTAEEKAFDLTPLAEQSGQLYGISATITRKF